VSLKSKEIIVHPSHETCCTNSRRKIWEGGGRERGRGEVGPCALSTYSSSWRLCPMVALRGAPLFLGAKIKSKIDIFHLPPPKFSSVVCTMAALYYYFQKC